MTATAKRATTATVATEWHDRITLAGAQEWACEPTTAPMELAAAVRVREPAGRIAEGLEGLPRVYGEE
jgi:hypothetical protein